MKKLTITLTFTLSFFILNAQKWQRYGTNRGIESTWIDCLYFDTAMKLQVGQIYGDLIQFHENKPNYLIQESVHDIVKDKNNTYWYAILGEFLSYNSSNGFKYNTWGWPGGVSQDVLSLEVDNNNNKWIGTLANGLVKYNDTNYTVYNTSNSSLPSNRIDDIVLGDSNTLWIGTTNGLVKIKNGTWTVYDATNGKLAYPSIKCLTVDKSNNIWIGYGWFNKTLSRFNGNSWTHYTHDTAINFGGISSLYCDDDSSVWIGTEVGVSQFKNNKFKVFANNKNPNIDQGLTDIMAITKDNKNRLWFGTYGDYLYSYKQGPFVYGFVFSDTNRNCIRDPSERPLANRKLIINPGNRKVVTDTIGYWELDSLPKGNYTISYDSTDKYWRRTCGMTQTFNVTQVDSETIAPNVGLNKQLLYGQVYLDDEFDTCQLSWRDKSLPNYKVKINPGNLQVNTDSFGYWEIPFIGNGLLEITLDTNNSLYTNDCTQKQTIQIDNKEEFKTKEFLLKSKTYCAYPTISVTCPSMRKCDTVPIYINIKNDKIAKGKLLNTKILLTLDTNFIFIKSPFVYNRIGSGRYEFYIDSLEPDSLLTIVVSVNINCNSKVGTTACVSAKLNPVNNCYLDILPDYSQNQCSLPYDNSNYIIDATCEIDSIKFIFTNIGTGNALCFSPLSFFLNGILVFKDSLKLNSNQIREIKIPKTGHTWTAIVSQHPLMPGKINPIKNFELCGDSSNWSQNVLSEFSTGDNSRYVDNECNIIRYSYDPNDKKSIPEGRGEFKLTNPNSILEYTIRFQNTGNDTARKIVIKDTLNSNLNISSFKNLGSSHKYTHFIQNNNISVWTFDKIYLPDSATDEKNSNGFLKFSISQKLNLPNETKISNRAAIYFDLNEPIFTNQTLNTIHRNVNRFDTVIHVSKSDSFKFSNKVFKKSGIYLEKLKNITGTDSFIVFVLNITNKKYLANRILKSCDTLKFNKKLYVKGGLYIDTIYPTFAIDTIYNLNIKINKSFKATLNFDTCKKIQFGGTPLNQTGIYNFKYQTSYGCDSIYDINLKLDTINRILEIQGNKIISLEDSGKYQWVKCSPFEKIDSAKNQFFIPSKNNKYAVILNNNKCIDTSYCINHNLYSKNQIFVYPNPVKNKFYFEFAEDLETSTIEIIDVFGRKIKQLTCKPCQKTEVDLSRFANGNYYLRILNNPDIKPIILTKTDKIP